MKTANMIVIARAPVMYDDVRESEAEVHFLTSEESPSLLTSSSFLLTSIDSFSSGVACLQTHVHSVPRTVIFNALSSDIDIAVGDVGCSTAVRSDVVVGCATAVHSAVAVGCDLVGRSDVAVGCALVALSDVAVGCD